MSNENKLVKLMSRLLILIQDYGYGHQEVMNFIRKHKDEHPEFVELAATLLLLEEENKETK